MLEWCNYFCKVLNLFIVTCSYCDIHTNVYFQVECLNDAAIFSRLIQVIKFIYEFIFFCNGTWMSCFGRLTWPRISELVIADFLSKVCF